MSKPPSKFKDRLWTALRWLITLGALVTVGLQITWSDRLHLGNGQWLEGRLQHRGGVEVFVDAAGKSHEVATEGVIDAKITEAVIPGFATLFRRMKWWPFAAAVGMNTAIIVLAARRWQMLLLTHGLDPGLGEAVRLTWIGMLANNVLPSSNGGDLVKCWCIWRRTPGKRLPAVMTVLMDRAIGMMSLWTTGAIALLLPGLRPPFPGIERVFFVGLLVIAGAGVVFFSGRIRRLLRIEQIIGLLPMGTHLAAIDRSLFHYRKHSGTLLGCFAISLVIHTTAIAAISILSKSLRMETPIINFYVFVPLILTSGALVPAIAGLGVVEGMFQFFFSKVGVQTSTAVALSILHRLVGLVCSLPGALPFYQETSRHGPPKLTDEPAAEPSLIASK